MKLNELIKILDTEDIALFIDDGSEYGTPAVYDNEEPKEVLGEYLNFEVSKLRTKDDTLMILLKQ